MTVLARKERLSPRRGTIAWRWLALAVIAHAALLALPRQPALVPGIGRPAPLELRLVSPESRESAPNPGVAVSRAAQPARPHTPAAPPARPVVPAAPATARADEGTPPPRTRDWSAAGLRDALNRFGFDTGAQEPSRALGLPPAPPGPSDGVTGGTPLGARIAESFAPARPVVLDRWLAADGSHHVVVELPGGETVCGRAERWDPMHPLVEHVMMFRSCAGGGRRSFSMPEDERPGWLKLR